jgi:2'-hydroxyisoflavone reductase
VGRGASLRILVLGGTGLLGRHLVEAALARGHRPTVFHRGRTGADLFPGVPRIVGDRAHDLGLLDGGEWDAVVDACGLLPASVREAAERLAGRAGHFTYVSSISAYRHPLPRGAAEDAPLTDPPDPEPERATPESYGGLKAGCEAAVREVLGERALIVRPTVLAGPHDPTDRLAYWLHRAAGWGEALAPGDPAGPVQLADARDVAAWLVRMVEAGEGGVYNAVGPSEPLSLGTLLETAREVTRGRRRMRWVPDAFLLERGVAPWTDLPFWLTPELRPFMEVDGAAARGRGLVFRPLRETLRDLHRQRFGGRGAAPPAAGISRARELGLLREWRRARRG